jgi:hypothetical protein
MACKMILLVLAAGAATASAGGQYYNTTTCTTTSGTYSPVETCFDDPAFVGSDGYPCAAWRADDCDTAEDPDEVKAACPFSCGVCTPNNCEDNPDYVDPSGYGCAGWEEFECGLAAEYFGYSTTQQTMLMQNCPKSCKFCGDQSDRGCKFPFSFNGEKHSRCVFDTDEGLEWCRGTQVSPVTGEPLWKVCVPAGTPCQFPFNYDGQSYDGCVPESDGSFAWCATGVDEDRNIIDGQWAVCDCNLKTDTVKVAITTVTKTDTVTSATKTTATTHTQTVTYPQLLTHGFALPPCTEGEAVIDSSAQVVEEANAEPEPEALDWSNVVVGSVASSTEEPSTTTTTPTDTTRTDTTTDYWTYWKNYNKNNKNDKNDKNNGMNDDKNGDMGGMERRDRARRKDSDKEARKEQEEYERDMKEGSISIFDEFVVGKWEYFTHQGAMCIPNSMDRAQFADYNLYQSRGWRAYLVSSEFLASRTTTSKTETKTSSTATVTTDTRPTTEPKTTEPKTSVGAQADPEQVVVVQTIAETTKVKVRTTRRPGLAAKTVEVNLKAVDEASNSRAQAASLDTTAIILIVAFGSVLLLLGAIYQLRKRRAAYSYESLLANIAEDRSSAGASQFYDSTVAEHLERLDSSYYYQGGAAAGSSHAITLRLDQDR